MAYASIDELAAALRIAVTAANTDSLQACLDAAAFEIDDALCRVDPLSPLSPGVDALANRVNLIRGVEWFKAQDAAFGVIGQSESGALQVPRGSFVPHAKLLTPGKEQFGVG